MYEDRDWHQHHPTVTRCHLCEYEDQILHMQRQIDRAAALISDFARHKSIGNHGAAEAAYIQALWWLENNTYGNATASARGPTWQPPTD